MDINGTIQLLYEQRGNLHKKYTHTTIYTIKYTTMTHQQNNKLKKINLISLLFDAPTLTHALTCCDLSCSLLRSLLFIFFLLYLTSTPLNVNFIA